MRYVMRAIQAMAGAMIVLAGSVATTLTSCARTGGEDQHSAELHYLTFGGSNGCTLNYAQEPEIRLCVAGTTGATLEKAKDYSKRALLTWLRALRQIDDQVSSNVVFSCSSPHLRVNMIPGSGTSYAGCGKANIYTAKTYGTYLHEFGHAVAALGDTYTGGSAGACRSGQPKSVMCWGAYGPNKDPQGFSLLYQDDVNGIQNQYRKITASRGILLVPPREQIDPLAPIDPNNPWPTGGSAPGTNNNDSPVYGEDIFVSVARKNSVQQAGETIRISTRINLDQVVVCAGDVTSLEACVAASSAYPVQYSDRIGDRKIYTTVVQIGSAPVFDLTIFAGGTTNGKFQASDRKAVRLKRD